MRARQTCPEPGRRALPDLWLLSDARNDAVLEDALSRLPRGSGFVYRHYHLKPEERRARFDALANEARRHGHLVILSSDRWRDAAEWGSDGRYGPYDPSKAASSDLLWLTAAHDAEEIASANQHGADGIFLSPVFPTRSHPGAEMLGKGEFHRLAAMSAAPVIALGGMTAERAAELGWTRWAAIDGLS